MFCVVPTSLQNELGAHRDKDKYLLSLSHDNRKGNIRRENVHKNN